ncbi:DUF1189 domain-containing protein [Aerococcaceae bacterium NML190073]|nr:DUF1189 domain-containing protein [Aerococcaceae bacterium NML190073]
MKKIISLIARGLRNPRHYIEALGLKRRQLQQIAFSAILVMSVASFLMIVLPLLHVAEDIAGVAEYIPNYTVNNQELTIQAPDKPLYYQADYAQVIIDDTVIRTGISNSILIPDDKARTINPGSLIGLYVFKDQAFLSLNQTLYSFDDIHNGTISPDALIAYVNSFAKMKGAILLVAFITTFIMSALSYLVQMLVIASMVSGFNLHLTQPIPFKDRLRLTMTVSLFPLILLQGLSLPVTIQFVLLMAITLYTIFLMFKKHTDFIRNITNG